MERKKKSTEAQIAAVVYMGNVTNDAEILRLKNIKSPKVSDMYAVAYSKNGRTQKWFKTKEALERFKESENSLGYKVMKL
jgi:hypothetical protein